MSGPATYEELSEATLFELYRDMLLIRSVEDEVERLFFRGLVRGSTHLCQGQEAVAVGACHGLRRGDTMTCTYRGHGAVLAKGAAPERVLAEILGRRGGLCDGQGGSMHLADPSIGAMGSFAIVGANLPIAVGLAWGHQLRGKSEATLTFFGDGSTNIGAFHEAMNLAAVWHLPVVFMCENNLYGEYTPIGHTTPVTHLVERALAYAMDAEMVDGNDVLAVRAVTERALERARSGGGPTFIEALTYRQKGHSRSDPGRYRPAEEVAHWMERDPISRFVGWLLDARMADEAWCAAERERVEARVKALSAAVLEWPEAELASLEPEGEATGAMAGR